MNRKVLGELAPWALVAAGASAAIYIIFGPGTADGDQNGSKREQQVTKGLQNLGNTCFMNSIIQAVASNSCFVVWVNNLCHKLPPKIKEFMPMTAGLHRVFEALASHDNTVHCPESMLDALVSHGWRTGGAEQDAHELFHVVMMAVMEELRMWCEPISLTEVSVALELPVCGIPQGVHVRKCSNDALPFRFSMDSNPLSGLLCSQMACLVCHRQRPSNITYFDSLSLSIPQPFWYSAVPVPLSRMISSYCGAEIVELDCEHCDEATAAIQRLSQLGRGAPERQGFNKRVYLARLPNCLCLHIQRLYWTNHGMPVKTQATVRCPETLNMAPYSHHRPRRTSPTSSSSSASAYYRLKAVVVHEGGAHGGHYVTYRCGLTDSSSWCRVSDASVRPASIDDVIECRAYMVFYERIKTTEGTISPVAVAANGAAISTAAETSASTTTAATSTQCHQQSS